MFVMVATQEEEEEEPITDVMKPIFIYRHSPYFKMTWPTPRVSDYPTPVATYTVQWPRGFTISCPGNQRIILIIRTFTFLMEKIHN